MDNRYQVFVSSTFVDLQEERQAVTQALLSLDHFPAGMELFPASDDDQWALIKGVIDDSDYYVLVVGGRYGSLSDDGISYTEKEFDYALSSGKPILAFLHEHPEELAAKKTDQNDHLRSQLEAFKKKAQTGRTVKYWNNPDQLKAQVIQSVSAETKRNPREGWVRASRASDPAIVESLRQEVDRLKVELNAATSSAPAGAENYASGGDKFELGFHYRDRQNDTKVHTFSLSWDTIFSEIAPILMDEANEGQLRRKLSSGLPLYEGVDFPKGAHLHSLLDDEFETIKVQLFALGLIKKSEKKHAISDTNRYWTLTPYGESLMMRLRAIRKPK